MAFMSFTAPGKSADDDTSVRLSLAILKRACEISGGQFKYPFELNGDGLADRVNSDCSGKDVDKCTVSPDGDYFCVLTQLKLTLQQQVAQPDSTKVTVMTGNPGPGTVNQSTG